MAARRSTSRVVPLAPQAPAPALPAAILGWLTGAEPLLVDFPGNAAGPVPARLLVELDARALEVAVSTRQPAALMFEAGDPARPLIVGLVQTPGSAREARVDGKRVVLTGTEEVELRCGEASISLKKDGKLVIRGAYVETRAKGTNRIKGGSVQIN
ncbi:DUF6484 domain-containing protein [Nannocystis sp. SCPEA4]|uniref:DUF6484 domain-containing protein n=1 Tax=Nannocystis sp. SCPEA4 TaxID=2996787 RepID=UPI00226F3BF9|nr:DUF6484 domain-containing protein [Nannocystis sp. SCPEA4]MCY1061373.1 DUF6484 domain-containing protein [Nannocystis sp. SCPEA4]